MKLDHLDVSKIGLCKELANHWVLGFKLLMQPDSKLLLTLAIALESVAMDIRRDVGARLEVDDGDN